VNGRKMNEGKEEIIVTLSLQTPKLITKGQRRVKKGNILTEII
jgi:hypothetical protein